MVTHGLKRRRKVIVGGHDHADIVIAGDRQSHEVDCQGNVDALLLRPPLRVPELPLYDRSSVLMPALTLFSVSGERSLALCGSGRPE